MRNTLLNAKDSEIPQAVGFNRCDPRFVSLLNDAQLRLSRMGKWWETYQRMRICILDNCITWPREVMTVEGFNVCRWSIPIRNMWYEFQENVAAPVIGCSGCLWDQNQLLSRNSVPTFRNIPTYGKIRIYSSASDDGAQLLLQGSDQNGVPIRTGSGYGEFVTLSQPYVETVHSFKYPGLTGVQKPVTLQRVLAYYVDPVTSSETQIAIWQPSEKNPSYIRDYLPNVPSLCSDVDAQNCDPCVDRGDGCDIADTSCTGYMAEAIVRLEFIPALVDTDWMFISNLDAVESMMLSIQLRRKRDYDEAEIERKNAVRALREELEAYSPAVRTVINAEIQGTALLSRVFGGYI